MIIDIFVGGVYFLFDVFVKLVVYKIVVVNLSDLVVMGVEFVWISLLFLLFEVKEDWLVEFVDGLYELM